ncbi:6120_t:CDS:2 [Racocetra fulgida]|uniref:6120_t:CDS:1 n=1 Tax=Racocetra fulgida TaxID=60492 RepID=A0A9N9C2I5_9GLOM|nr:6120_t:CDS:2 [Racocetra fulgida]
MSPPPPGLIIVTFPIPSILSPQHHPIQDLAKEHLIPIVSAIIGETDMTKAKTHFIGPCPCIKLDDSTYDPREDDDYNVDEGRPLDNLSREKLEWEEEYDDNDYRNPGERQEMLDQN